MNLYLFKNFKNLRLENNLVYQAIKKNRILYSFVLTLVSLSNLFEFLFFYDLSDFFKTLFLTNQNSLNSAIIKILIVIAWSISTLSFRYFNLLLNAKAAKDLSTLLLENLTFLTFPQFNKLGKNKLLALSTINLDLVLNAIVLKIPILINLILSVFIGIFIIYKNLGLDTLYLIAFSILLLIIFVQLTKNYAYKFGKIRAKKTEDIYQYSNFFIDSIKEIFIQKTVNFFSSPLSKAQYMKTSAEGKADFVSMIPRETIQFMAYILIICLGIIGSNLPSFDIKPFLPSVATLLIVAQRIPPLINKSYKFLFSIINVLPILKQYNFADNNTNLNYKNAKSSFYIEKNLSSIEIKKAYIGFDKEKPLFYLNNLSIKAGSSLIIYGRSGIGKTTLLETIVGLRKPLEGSIVYLDINKEIINEFRSISYVPQKISLPADNILDCLSLTNPKVKDFQTNEKIKKDLYRVLKICKIWDEYIFSYGDLLKPLGNGCLNLSGGQRQRLAIARALIQNKQILVLDEATSGLDKKIEKEIMKNILSGFKNLTIIAISHSSQLIPLFQNCYDLENNNLSSERYF